MEYAIEPQFTQARHQGLGSSFWFLFTFLLLALYDDAVLRKVKNVSWSEYHNLS